MAEKQPPGKNPSLQKITVPRSVRRNLFGRDPDKSLDDLARDREELSQRQEDQFKERWNFDIHMDMPLEGKYEWTECVPLNQQVPLLYVPCTNSTSIASSSSKTRDEADENLQSMPSGIATTAVSLLPSQDLVPPISENFSEILPSSSTHVPTSEGKICKPYAKRQRPSSPEEESENLPIPKSPKR